jgi:cobalt-zinc-cadmium efflux system protein
MGAALVCNNYRTSAGRRCVRDAYSRAAGFKSRLTNFRIEATRKMSRRKRGFMAGEHKGRDADFRSKTRRLALSIGLGVALVAAEATVGFLTHSLALVSDAGHNAADILAVALSLIAVYVMARPPTERRTYGFGRVGILTALVNSAALVAVGGLLVYESIRRIQHIQPVSGYAVILVAGIAIVINSAVALTLLRHRTDLNIKSAFFHQVLDAIVSLGVLIAGIIIVFTKWYYADPLIALVISIFIFRAAYEIIVEATDILLESVPRHINLADIQRAIESIPGVEAVHHVHVWELGSGVYALSGHVEVEDKMLSECNTIVGEIAQNLHDEFNIVHPTIQIESASSACPIVLPAPSGEE